MKMIRQAIGAALILAAVTQAAQAAVEIPTNYWDHNASGTWSATHTNNAPSNVAGWSDVTGDAVPDVPDDTNLTDGTNVTARFVAMSGQTITLDSSRTVGRLWYNWDGAVGATASGTLTLNASGGSVLTLAREGAVPQIHIGFRFTQNSTTIGVTINAPLAGTNGFTIGDPGTFMYDGYGLVLGGANTISGTIGGTGYRQLTLKNVQAAQNATLQLSSAGTLRLRSDTDGATFLTAHLTHQDSATAATISVETNTAAGGTGHTLLLAGDYTMPGRTLSIAGNGGYRLEMTGNASNSSAAAIGMITADSANLKLSGSRFDIGAGMQLGGALATGTNEISGVIAGRGSITKLADVSRWVLSGNNIYTGVTSIAGGTLAISGSGSISSSAVINVAAGAVFDGQNAASFTVTSNQTLKGEGAVLGNLSALAGSKLSPGTNGIGTLTMTGNVSVAGSWLADVSALTGICDRVDIAGDLALTSDSKLILATNGVFTDFASYTLATYSGVRSGMFGTVSNLPAKMRIDYGRGVNSAIRLWGPAPACTVFFR